MTINNAYYGVPPQNTLDTENRYSYAASAGQTVFAATYSVGYVDVYINGSRISDFTATSGTSITLTTAASLNDEVVIIAKKMAPAVGVGAVSSVVTNFGVTGILSCAQGTDIASASVLGLDGTTANTVNVTGTTTITNMTLAAGSSRVLRFTGSLWLQASGTFVLPNGIQSLLVNAGDIMTVVGISPNIVVVASTTASISVDKGDNPIINGAMEIDQANGGAAVTVNAAGPIYSVDMWAGSGTAAAGAFTLQQQSATPPTGFKNYLRATVTTADAAPAATSYYSIQHRAVEGVNWSRFSYGVANAVTTTLSFWVRSSVAGTFGGAIENGAGNRSYPFQYTISSANVWQRVPVTIPGDVLGTWATDNTTGAYIIFDLGSGSNYTGPAGTWAAASYSGANGDTKLISTLSATFDITGVQIEAGTVATAFKHLSFGEELRRCQRYLPCVYPLGNAAIGDPIGVGNAYSTSGGYIFLKFTVPARAPVTAYSSPNIGLFSGGQWGSSFSPVTAFTITSGGLEGVCLQFTTTTAVLAASQVCSVQTNAATAKLLFTGARL